MIRFLHHYLITTMLFVVGIGFYLFFLLRGL